MWPVANNNNSEYSDQLARLLNSQNGPNNNFAAVAAANSNGQVDSLTLAAALRQQEVMALAAATGLDAATVSSLMAANNNPNSSSLAHTLALARHQQQQQQAALDSLALARMATLQQQQQLPLSTLAGLTNHPSGLAALGLGETPATLPSSGSVDAANLAAVKASDAMEHQQRAQVLAKVASMGPAHEQAAAALQQLGSHAATEADVASLTVALRKTSEADVPETAAAAAVSSQSAPVAAKSAAPAASGTSRGVNPLHLKKQSFPEKVYFMLEELEEGDNGGMKVPQNSCVGTHVISFVAEGTAFSIHNPRAFETDVMPMYFSSNRMSSFQRQLNIYGFERVEKGPWRGAYQHKFFQKGQPGLLHKIVRTKQPSKSKATPRNKPAASSKSKAGEKA
uniref:HSF-type DNA-binding domain-containing protein n=1 Tax=Entomoneis paludosa TaxID=265537 RepID=A0A7S2Y4L2_9STRA|mmetsp:Transcript_16470/g.33981  ORF Transcript_16470/g.33981 Transcript_16470/m.33981 type:complete len:396 (+) Transcript_16470:115-1302(+)|eukprot:CAMPEP_0172475128 /NCGR_PEP_ID=MMETSP1065-20121228/69709_1 /TAXON_ID=265537 /ORGANISM="Amphiprora paludosa, Strain CCMP125" /LENGTH=395 /DNA_ID=CAMNT_0013233323 /DNA_START=779 /DNA_END=1966 /DNA_ORIENTATION=-